MTGTTGAAHSESHQRTTTYCASRSPGGVDVFWCSASISALSSVSFMTAVMLRTSVATMSGDCVMAHTANSVRYSSSLCPGQCEPLPGESGPGGA